MKTNFLLSVLLSAGLAANAQQADLANGATQQEFRTERVALYSRADAGESALLQLLMDIDSKLTEIELTRMGTNTGFYSREACQQMRQLCDQWLEQAESLSSEESAKIYYEISAQWATFLADGKNPGGVPFTTDCEDWTIQVLGEADNFARTPETDDGDRFGAPLHWTVENFGFGDQAGIDGITGYDCLHLEVWWNNNAYAENGYDISNVRLYQKAMLPAGKYYFGASYPSDEANEDLYIFASTELIATSDIPTQSIAYEKVNLAPADGTFRGIYFTLTEDTKVYLGWQADFTNVSANNLRASGVKLLYIGDGTYNGIAEMPHPSRTAAAREYYSLQGLRLQAPPQRGFYLVKQAGQTLKYYKK